MNKFFKSFLIVIALFIFLTGCAKKDNHLTLNALNLEELLDLMNNKETFLFATFNDNDDNFTNFKKVIENYQDNTKNYVYFLNYSSLSFIESEYLNTLTDNQDYSLALYYVSEGQIKSSVLNPLTTADILEKIENAKPKELDLSKYYQLRDSRYNKGIDELANGFISNAYASFYQALPKEEAQEILNEENLFNLIGLWSTSEKNKNKCEYLNLNISANENKFYKSYYNGKCDSFTEEKYQITVYDYYIHDDVIMIKKEKEEQYQKLYEIKELTSDILKIWDNKKNYTLVKID